MSRVLAPTAEAIIEAAAALRRGRLVAFPTETVYGLGAAATSDAAVAAVYRAKGRPARNPLIVHVAGPPGHGRSRSWTSARRSWPGRSGQGR